MTHAQPPSNIDNNLEPNEQPSAIPDVLFNDSVEVALPNNLVESEKVKTSKTIFVNSFLFPDNSCFEQLGFTVFRIKFYNSIPKDYYEINKHKSFILAFNNNDIKTINETIECFKSLGIDNYKIALPQHGLTWNDLNLSDQLTTDKIESTLDKAYLQGRLFLATSALDYFSIYLKQHQDTKTLIFEFDSGMFKGYLKELKSDTGIDYQPKVELLADCNIRLHYSVIDDSQDNKRKIEHYLELYSEREGWGNIKLTAAELTHLGSFKIALQNHRQIFYGNSKDLTELTNYLFETKPPKIRALSAIGYDDESKGYYFPNFAYNFDGVTLYANTHKYFMNASIPEVSIKPFMGCSDSVIKRNFSSVCICIDLTRFLDQIYKAYYYKGWLALGFYISSLFSHIVFEHYGFFPFLSIYGDPHTGKSFISKLLNRCFFIDSEGQTITASNTVKDHLIKISQKSNLVCALLEGGKNSRFDYDDILPLYNRNPLYSAATHSQGNKTHDLHLKATLSFVWNHEHFTAKAAKERVISLRFTDREINEKTRGAWGELNNYTPEQLSDVGHQLLTDRKWFEDDLINDIRHYAIILEQKGVTVPRIAENYAIALGGIICFFRLLGKDPEIDYNINSLIGYAIECAKHKLETTKTELHLADHFFESIQNLNDCTTGVVIKRNEIVIHLPTALKHLKQNGNDFDKDKRKLIAELKDHNRFSTVKSTREFMSVFGKTCDAYHFENDVPIRSRR